MQSSKRYSSMLIEPLCALVHATVDKHIDWTTITLFIGTTACSSNPCVYICLNRPGGYSCACPDNLILVMRNGQVHCLCPAGTKIEPDGECKLTSKLFHIDLSS